MLDGSTGESCKYIHNIVALFVCLLWLLLEFTYRTNKNSDNRVCARLHYWAGWLN